MQNKSPCLFYPFTGIIETADVFRTCLRRRINNTRSTNSAAVAFMTKGGISMLVRRGEIYYADLSPVVGSEQGGIRPVLIVQNDVGNRHSPTVIAAAITSRREKAKLPTHIDVQAATCGLTKDSIVLLEQIRTLDKRRLKDRMGELDEPSMTRVDHALQVSFGLPL
jgi:mRNA interferase MazF